MQERTCKCGTKFQPRKGNHKWCSIACYSKACTERRRAKPHEVVCRRCGTTFSTTNPSTKSCGLECSRRARAEYHRDRDRVPSRPKGAMGWEEVVSWRSAESS